MGRFPLLTMVACASGLLDAAGSARAATPAEAERVAHARRLEGESIRLDGALDESAWAAASWIRGLTQKDPVEGVPGGELTEVAFLYDDNSLYVGARLATPLTARVSAPAMTWARPSPSSSPWTPTTTAARPTPSA